jgi:hypothetical protein
LEEQVQLEEQALQQLEQLMLAHLQLSVSVA